MLLRLTYRLGFRDPLDWILKSVLLTCRYWVFGLPNVPVVFDIILAGYHRLPPRSNEETYRYTESIRHVCPQRRATIFKSPLPRVKVPNMMELL